MAYIRRPLPARDLFAFIISSHAGSSTQDSFAAYTDDSSSFPEHKRMRSPTCRALFGPPRYHDGYASCTDDTFTDCSGVFLGMYIQVSQLENAVIRRVLTNASVEAE